MFPRYDILKIYDLIDFNTCVYIYEVFHNQSLRHYKTNFQCHQIKKYKNDLYVMIARTRRKQFSMTIKGVSLWNSLHNLVKLSSSLRIKKE